MTTSLQGLSSNPIPLPDLTATESLAKKLALHLRRGDTVLLKGSLGAGKTTFARYLLVALGITDDVPSPTFTLLQTYETKKFPVTHFDLYRLKNANELDELGWDEICNDNLTLIEWPERAGNRLPSDYLSMHFMMDANGQRVCNFETHGIWQQRLQDMQ